MNEPICANLLGYFSLFETTHWCLNLFSLEKKGCDTHFINIFAAFVLLYYEGRTVVKEAL